MQDFLLLNPNVLGGSDDIQFLGGRTYGVSYVQDGQASTNAIFGTVGNSAPGLDAIGEIQVLSNSYSAEYGGLAGVVVTTKRGGNSHNGSAFYDYNSDGLNALTYNQKQAGAERGDPNADTHAAPLGAEPGRPDLPRTRPSSSQTTRDRHRRIYGGGRANVPTAAMRAGDFSGANFTIRDPLTGQPFPGNVIPANRIDPTAQRILDFYYPLPNAGTFRAAWGCTSSSSRRPATGTAPTSASTTRPRRTTRCSCAPATSTETRAASSSSRATRSPTSGSGTEADDRHRGHGVDEDPFSDQINEFRIGYNYDQTERQSHFLVAEANAAMGLETAPSLGPGQVGFPT